MTHPMDDLLAELEAAERSVPDPPVETSDRVWTAIETRLADGPPPPPLDDAPLFPPGTGGSGLSLVKIVGGLAVLGAIVGGALALSSRPSVPPRGSEPTPAVAPAVQASEPSERPHPPEVAPDPVAPPAPDPVPEPVLNHDPAAEPAGPAPKPGRVEKRKSAPAEPRTLADELALMQSITASLKASDASRTLRLVREHERDFPKGQFVEERRAAKARGLCRKGKASAGRKEAARFEKRWPKSIHLSAVREDCDLD